MTTPTIRAFVRRVRPRTSPSRAGLPWIAYGHRRSSTGITLYTPTSFRSSHAEAMQAAQVILAELDAELMAEVHASRASRRVEPTT